MIIDSTPSSLDLSMISFMAGISISQPSKPKRFSEVHLRARKASNLHNSQRLFDELAGWKGIHLPSSTRHTSQQKSFAIGIQSHGAWRFKTFSNPGALFK